jgi:hypothetical protein
MEVGKKFISVDLLEKFFFHFFRNGQKTDQIIFLLKRINIQVEIIGFET